VTFWRDDAAYSSGAEASTSAAAGSTPPGSDAKDGPSGATGAGKAPSKGLPLWQEAIVLLVTAVVLAVVVKAFFVQAFFVPSVSMEPQFLKGDRILVEKVSYWNNDVHRGDVIVFDDRAGWLTNTQSRTADGLLQRGLEAVGLYPTGGHLVKRIVGIGGDRVVCCDTRDRITVNGQALEESAYLKRGVVPSEQDFDVTVPDGSLWVMGDNRLESGDSRLHTADPGGGYVSVDDVVGKVWGIVWPVGRLEVLDRPEVFDDPALDPS
jgi:signal peptidase I